MNWYLFSARLSPLPFVALVALLAACACTRLVDPCRKGSRWSDSTQACIPLHPADAGDASTGPDEREVDSGEGPMDASTQDAQPPDAADDAGLDATADSGDEDATVDASEHDAGDAGEADADAETPLACSPEDEAAWRAFHLSGNVVQSIGECFARDPVGCAKGLCPLDDCLREKAQVVACDTCVATEIQCVMTHCKGACGASDTDDSCRACACAHGCVAAFDACALEPLNVCSDCNETTCVNASVLPPELIMVVVSPLLY